MVVVDHARILQVGVPWTSHLIVHRLVVLWNSI